MSTEVVSHRARSDQTREVFETSIKSAFGLCREAAGGQLARREMVGEAVAAHAFVGAGFVGAGAAA